MSKMMKKWLFENLDANSAIFRDSLFSILENKMFLMIYSAVTDDISSKFLLSLFDVLDYDILKDLLVSYAGQTIILPTELELNTYFCIFLAVLIDVSEIQDYAVKHYLSKKQFNLQKTLENEKYKEFYTKIKKLVKTKKLGL